MVAVSLKKNFFKQKTAYEIGSGLVGSEMCIRDRQNSLVRYSLKHNCCHRPTTVRTAFFSCCRGIYMYASAGATAIIFWIASASF